MNGDKADLQSQFSLAYAQAVASTAGVFVQIADRGFDKDGIDMTVLERGTRKSRTSTRLDLQVKSYTARHKGTLGPTESGSFVLTIESSVQPQLAAVSELPGIEPEPFDRSVCLALAHATVSARRIVDQISVTRSMEALPGPAYQQAAQAHAAGVWISCEGELVRQGDTTTLLNPRNLRALVADTARDT